MKIEELAEKIVQKHKPTFAYVDYGNECIRAGLKVALDIIRKSRPETPGLGIVQLEITNALEGRAELPEVEG